MYQYSRHYIIVRLAAADLLEQMEWNRAKIAQDRGTGDDEALTPKKLA